VTEEPAAKKVLVVDDDEAVARFVSSVVEKGGLEPVAVHTGEAAETALEKERFVLAIVDINLPDGSGLDLASEMKSRDSALPVVIITGFPGGHNVRESLGASVDAYLVKPVNASILLTLLSQLVAEK
jgi:DNA-binding response OmpR family regulator